MLEHTRQLKITQPTGRVDYIPIDSYNKPEIVVRSQMCWYGTGTLFEIDGKAFRKIHVNDTIKGYAELQEER